MRRLVVFENITLDGYFSGKTGDLSWANKSQPDAEWDDFVASNASGGGVLVFGRVTYEMMASFWPTPLAREKAPAVAKGMNERSKIVFSRTLDKASWENTRLLDGDVATVVRRLKGEAGPDMAILGSGSVVSQVAQAGLVDEFQLVVNPVALGEGKSLFAGIKAKVPLTLTKTRAFKNGNVLLVYAPA